MKTHNVIISGGDGIISQIALSRSYYTETVDGLFEIKEDLKRLISKTDKKWISIKIETPLDDVSGDYVDEILALTTLPMRLIIPGDKYEEFFYNEEWDPEKWQNAIDSVMTEYYDYDKEEDYINANL